MFSSFKNVLLVGLVLIGTSWVFCDCVQAQTYVIGPAPTVTVHRPVYYSYRPVVSVPETYTAYYAPPVPIAPVAVAPVPTVSAYYVPTSTVTYHYPAPVFPIRRFRRYAVPVAPVFVPRVYAWGY